MQHHFISNECDLCPETFDKGKHFKIHIESVHEGKKPHECEICNETFDGEEQLQIHIQSVHEAKKRYDLKHCHESFDKNPHQISSCGEKTL